MANTPTNTSRDMTSNTTLLWKERRMIKTITGCPPCMERDWCQGSEVPLALSYFVNIHTLNICHTGLFQEMNVEQTEHRTSNFQRWTSNNDVAPLCNLISFVFKNPMLNLEWLFLFLFSRFDTRHRYRTGSVRSSAGGEKWNSGLRLEAPTPRRVRLTRSYYGPCQAPKYESK
jgi:hypothetical protein